MSGGATTPFMLAANTVTTKYIYQSSTPFSPLGKILGLQASDAAVPQVVATYGRGLLNEAGLA